MNRKEIEERKRNRWQMAYDHREIARTIGELSPECNGVELHIHLSLHLPSARMSRNSM